MSEDTDVKSADYLFDKTLFGVRLAHSEIGTYMSRWIATFGKDGRTVRLHVIKEADGDRCLHDHPWSFWTFVLWGGYTEEYEHYGQRRVWPLSINRRPLNFRHRITKLHARVAVTLVFTSPEQREWGFYTNEGWRPWTAFVKAGVAMRALWCAK